MRKIGKFLFGFATISLPIVLMVKKLLNDGEKGEQKSNMIKVDVVDKHTEGGENLNE